MLRSSIRHAQSIIYHPNLMKSSSDERVRLWPSLQVKNLTGLLNSSFCMWAVCGLREVCKTIRDWEFFIPKWSHTYGSWNMMTKLTNTPPVYPKIKKSHAPLEACFFIHVFKSTSGYDGCAPRICVGISILVHLQLPDHNSAPELCWYYPESSKSLTETGFCWIFESAIVKPRVM